MITVYHFTEAKHVDNILKNGLSPKSKYEVFSDIRENVVYCWLSPKDNKLQYEDQVCLEVSVDENQCKVADMEYISLAMMYKYGGQKYGGLNTPINLEASNLFIKIYETTAVEIDKYQNHFFSPEVLVKGYISTKYIKIFNYTK